MILVLAFGSLAAALLPLVTALVSVAVGLGVGIVAGVVTLATAAPTPATMIGLGVGIDYALVLTTRFRQDLMDGHDPLDAAARASATSGRAVVVARRHGRPRDTEPVRLRHRLSDVTPGPAPAPAPAPSSADVR